MIPQEQVSLWGETQKEGVGKGASGTVRSPLWAAGLHALVSLWDHGEGASALSERPRGRICPLPGLPRRLSAPPAPRCPVSEEPWAAEGTCRQAARETMVWPPSQARESLGAPAGQGGAGHVGGAGLWAEPAV